MGFIAIHWSSLGAYSDSLGGNGPYSVHCVSFVATGVLGSLGVNWGSLGFVEDHWDSQGIIGVHWSSLDFIGVH